MLKDSRFELNINEENFQDDTIFEERNMMAVGEQIDNPVRRGLERERNLGNLRAQWRLGVRIKYYPNHNERSFCISTKIDDTDM
jgi:hypothetical protein